MGWNNWPPAPGTDIQKYDWIIQAWEALREKHKALGNPNWPPTAIVWASGTITSVTDNGDGTLTFGVDNVAGWPTETNCCTGGFEYRHCNKSGCLCPPCYIPTRYDIVINVDEHDTRTQVRGMITAVAVIGSGDSATGTVTIQSDKTLNMVTAKFLTGLSQINGKKYAIVKAGGPYVLDRLPERPNDPEEWIGSMAAADGYWPDDDSTDPETEEVIHNGPQYTVLTDSLAESLENPPQWATDKWVGLQVMAFVGGKLVRLPIVHNDDANLYIAHQTSAPSGSYLIVKSTDKAMPDRSVWRPHQWYYGGANYEAGHSYYDELVTAYVPKTNERWDEGDPCGDGSKPCEEVGHGAFDEDLQKPWDFEALCICGQAGDYVNPALHKSIRQLQANIVAVAANYIKKGWSGGKYPSKYTPAKLFYDGGINAGSSTIGFTVTGSDSSGDLGYYSFSTSGYNGKSLCYTIEDKYGKHSAGQGTPNSSGVVVVSEYGNRPQVPPAGKEIDNPLVGRKVYYSAGWTRYRPRWFKYLYEKTVFRPDLISIGEDSPVYIVADPPVALTDDETGKYTCEGNGATFGGWMTHGKSVGGVVISETGVIQDSVETFVTGEVYRYIGDNMADPFPGGNQSDYPAGLLVPYDDKKYRGNLSDVNQKQRDDSRSGSVTGRSKNSLTDSTKNWWSGWGNTGGTLRVESGTATAGSNGTTLKDSTKDTTDEYEPHSCWWATGRFNTGLGVYGGFILEIDKTRTLPADDATLLTNPTATVTQTVTFKVPIDSTSNGAGGIVVNFTAFEIPKYNGADQTWTWESFTIATGDNYRIAEPAYELNKWRGRKVQIIEAGGSTRVVEVTHSDRDTLWFAPQTNPILPHAVYLIEEDRTGGIYKWDGSKMVVATGADTPRTGTNGVAHDFHVNPTENLEGWVKDYGRVHLGDCMDASTLYYEIYTVLNLLKDWTRDFSWVARGDPETEELNYGLWPSQQSFGSYEAYATPADKALAGDTSSDNSNVFHLSMWTDEFLGLRDGLLRQVFESGGFFPWKQEQDTAPRRSFAFTGSYGAAHGIDASNFYRNQPWLNMFGLGMSIDGPISSFAHGKMANVPMLVPATIDMYVYNEIGVDEDGVPFDEGHTVDPHPGDGSGVPINYWTDISYQFDAGDTGGEYRSWTYYTTEANDAETVIASAIYGAADAFDNLIGHEEGCPDYYPACHMVSDFPDDFGPPQDMQQQVNSMDNTLPHSVNRDALTYAWFMTEYQGSLVTEQVAVFRCEMEYMA